MSIWTTYWPLSFLLSSGDIGGKRLISKRSAVPQDNNRLFPELWKMEWPCFTRCSKKQHSPNYLQGSTAFRPTDLLYCGWYDCLTHPTFVTGGSSNWGYVFPPITFKRLPWLVMDRFIRKGYYTIGALKTNRVLYPCGIRRKPVHLHFICGKQNQLSTSWPLAAVNSMYAAMKENWMTAQMQNYPRRRSWTPI